MFLLKNLSLLLYCKKINMATSKTPMDAERVRDDAGLENRPIYLGGGERGGGRGGGEMSKQLRNKSLIWAVLALKSK